MNDGGTKPGLFCGFAGVVPVDLIGGGMNRGTAGASLLGVLREIGGGKNIGGFNFSASVLIGGGKKVGGTNFLVSGGFGGLNAGGGRY